jgi:hypothetical protein
VAGIAIFSIGEMTCHPKYFSYIGLIAPQDKKAVYMGYSFLYGVIGALVGSTVGGEMYQAFLTPLMGREGAGPTLRVFWMVFAVLGVVTTVVLYGYHRFFGEDNRKTRARARGIISVVYVLLILGAGGILYLVFSKQGGIPIKTAIQAGIMITVGMGGLLTLRATRATAAGPARGQ